VPPPIRSRFRVLWRLVRWTAILVFGGLVVFFALTRTEVGRDVVRSQLEQRFNERFAGSIEVDRLAGSLLHEVVGTGLTLTDADGRVVATVDSLRAEPTWLSVLTSGLQFEQLTLVRPHVHLHRTASGRWTLRGSLRASAPTDTSESVLSLRSISGDIEIQDGRLMTSRDGPPPQVVATNWSFDYTRSVADSISLRASIDGTPRSREIHVESGALRLPNQDLVLHAATGTITRSGTRWTVDEAAVNLGKTRLRGNGSVRLSPSSSGASTVDVRLSESRLVNDELQRLSPRYPLRDTMIVEGRLGGRPDRIVLNRFSLTRNQSFLELEGSAHGLPDSVDVDLRITESRLGPADVRAVWPRADQPAFQSAGPVRLSASADGTIRWESSPTKPTVELDGRLDARSDVGTVAGSWSLDRSGSDTRYEATLDATRLDPAALLQRPALAGQLTGRVELDGRGTRWETLSGTAILELSSSQIGSVSLAEARGEVEVDTQTIRGQLRGHQPGPGRFAVQGAFDGRSARPTLNATASTSDLDLGAWIPSAPSSRLNGTLTVEGQAATWASATGTLVAAIDSSRLERGDSTVALPPHQTTLRLSLPATEEPRLEISGDVAHVQVDGPLLSPAFRSAGQQWATALRRAAIDAFEKPIGNREAPRAPSRPLDALRSRTLSVFSEAGRGQSIRLDASATLSEADLLRRWWPAAPDEADGAMAEATLTVGPDTLQFSGSATADRIRYGSSLVSNASGTYHLTAPHTTSVLETLHTRATVQADTARFQNRIVEKPHVHFDLTEETGRLRAQTQTWGALRSIRFGADVALLPDRNRFDLDEFTIETKSGTWALPTPGTVLGYSDALAFEGLTLESRGAEAVERQSLRIHGTFSNRPADTLYVDADSVSVFPFSQLANLSRPIGGQLNGRLALTGGWEQPRAEGRFTVDRLSYDRRVVGTLQLRSELASARPDLRIDASLSPPAPSPDSLEGGDLVPQGPRAVEQNRLRLSGRIRLPGLERFPERQDTGDPLDLQMDVERADLFFFEYIFDEQLGQTEGYATGTVQIGGAFSDPVFDASLELREGEFTLPAFGLTYAISGPVEIDREGIHPRSVSLSDEEGSATIDGSIFFNDYQFFSFDLSAELDELLIIDVPNAENSPFYGTIRASGPAFLTGPLSDATLRSPNARTTPDSELFIPASRTNVNSGSGYIVFADSTGRVPTPPASNRRSGILGDRPEGIPTFLEGLDLNINVVAPEGSTVHLVFDPLVGDVVTAEASGRVQLQLEGGEFSVFGSLTLDDGTYQFTAGEVFTRDFSLEGGSITWDGDPVNAQLDIQARYRTRASSQGLPGFDENRGRIPVEVLLDIQGRVETPQVDLGLSLTQEDRNTLVGSEALNAFLNQPDQATEFATSVLLTNTFLLAGEASTEGEATESGSVDEGLSAAGNQLAFNSLSQLVASQLNQYLGAALPNADLNLGVQGETPSDLDLIYGVNLRLLDDRLLIRGEGVYTGDQTDDQSAQGPRGEFLVEVQLTPRVRAEAFYRRAGDELTRGQTYTRSAGAGLSYQTEFPTWKALFDTVFGWLVPDPEADDRPGPPDEEETDSVARRPDRTAEPEGASEGADP